MMFSSASDLDSFCDPGVCEAVVCSAGQLPRHLPGHRGQAQPQRVPRPRDLGNIGVNIPGQVRRGAACNNIAMKYFFTFKERILY